MPAKPSARPNPDWPTLRDRLTAAGHDVADLLARPLFVVAIRGLFSRTIGAPGNDINAYDDALYIVRPRAGKDPEVKTCNANTDPTRYGWNAKAGKYMARLKDGRYTFRRRLHGGRYMAYGQDGSPVTVERIDATGAVRATETGSFGIDLHPGGINTTSSEGCITMPRDQWEGKTGVDATILNTAGKDWWPFILITASA